MITSKWRSRKAEDHEAVGLVQAKRRGREGAKTNLFSVQ
jgi:hypothetical protein